MSLPAREVGVRARSRSAAGAGHFWGGEKTEAGVHAFGRGEKKSRSSGESKILERTAVHLSFSAEKKKTEGAP